MFCGTTFSVSHIENLEMITGSYWIKCKESVEEKKTASSRANLTAWKSKQEPETLVASEKWKYL